MRRTSFFAGFAALLAICVAAVGPFALADDDHGDNHERGSAGGHHGHGDHDRILKSVRAGKILPLSRLKAMVLARWPGELLDVSIGKENGRILYEFRILRDEGRMTEVEVDAADGKIIEVENE